MSGILGDFLLVGGRFFYYADLNIFYCIPPYNSFSVAKGCLLFIIFVSQKPEQPQDGLTFSATIFDRQNETPQS